MKRKIEDYKGQKVAIHCSTKEEWDKIVDILPSGRSVKKNYWQNSVNDGKSDTINIEGYSWSPKKHFENTGYTIYPASDFLEEESVNSLLENEIYYNLYSNNIVRWKNPTGGNYLGYGCTIYKSDYGGNFSSNVKQYRLTTPEEKHWFLECEKAGKFIPYDEAMGTFEKSFRFNIGDEIKAKPGGYFISDPEFFAESHKAQFPSSESGILGKITERTQAQGFNWYKCGLGNWITEEGVKLIKEDIPEYDECIKTSKSLVGRYLKALVDKPQSTSLNKDEYIKITAKYSENQYKLEDGWVYTINNKTQHHWQLMPEGFNPRVVYYQGKWAEIVSNEPEINTYGLKVGDTLKQEIINAWAYIEGNFCPNVQEGWVGIFSNYIEDRKIEDFRDIDGQIGFHVSGCTEGTHYLKAEGFKEFADNFYKKEVKSWIQEQDEMLNVIIKQHPLTPKECYSSNEIIIPQVIKVQKTIQKITIESPTELDLKLKTIKPKQIQTIKI